MVEEPRVRAAVNKAHIRALKERFRRKKVCWGGLVGWVGKGENGGGEGEGGGLRRGLEIL